MGGRARTLAPLVLPQPGSLDSYRRQSVARTHTPLLFQSFFYSAFAILLAHRATAVRRSVSYQFFFIFPLLHFGLRLQLTSNVKMWNGHLFFANDIMK